MGRTSLTPRNDPPQLQRLAPRLNAWRATRRPGQRIPEALWKAAAQLARVHGLSRTAATLKLSYYALQRRLADLSGPPSRGGPAPGFVELSAPAAPVGPGESGTLEWVQGSGRLTLRLPHARGRDLLPLVQLFLRHRS